LYANIVGFHDSWKLLKRSLRQKKVYLC